MHVRLIIFIILTLLGGGLLSVAAQDVDGPASWRVPDLTPIGELPAQVFESLDRDSLRRSGGCSRLPCPPGTTYTGYRVALGYASAVDVLRDGLLETLPSGDRVIRMRFEIPGATDLSFGFGRYRMPEGATLYIFSPEYRIFDGRYSFGPWDASKNKPHGEFLDTHASGRNGRSRVDSF